MVLLLMHAQTLVKIRLTSTQTNKQNIRLFILKILSGNKILTSFKGHTSVRNGQKWTLKNSKLDVVHNNACAKFSRNPFIHSQDIERKRNSDFNKGRNSVMK